MICVRGLTRWLLRYGFLYPEEAPLEQTGRMGLSAELCSSWSRFASEASRRCSIKAIFMAVALVHLGLTCISGR